MYLCGLQDDLVGKVEPVNPKGVTDAKHKKSKNITKAIWIKTRSENDVKPKRYCLTESKIVDRF